MITVRWVDCRTISGFWFKRSSSCKDILDAWLFGFAGLFLLFLLAFFFFCFPLSSYNYCCSFEACWGNTQIHDLPFSWGLILTCVALVESGCNHAPVVVPWLFACNCIGMKKVVLCLGEAWCWGLDAQKRAGRVTAWPFLRSGSFLVGTFPIYFKSSLMYCLCSILLGFICLGSGLKGHVVSLGLLSINAWLFSVEMQAVPFIIWWLQGDAARSSCSW